MSKDTQTAHDRIEFDKAIYQARLDEIRRDLELGRIAKEAADAAIAEEGRKLIALAGGSKSQVRREGQSGMSYQILAGAVAIAIPVLSMGSYLYLGNPDQPDQSLASRLAVSPEDQSIDELVARAEAHLSANPADARGWSVIAPVYARMGRLSEAAKAWQNLYRLQPDYPQIRSTLAESLVAIADGVVTEDARKLFAEELDLDQSSAKARFYLAMALGQQGLHAQAVEAWNELIEGGTPNAPWMSAALQFRDASQEASGMNVTETMPGPTNEDVVAASDMSDDDRNAMIRGMVEGLAEKLQNNPEDKAGWQRLVQSYIVLGEVDQARSAIEAAINSNTNDTEFAKQMRAFGDKISQ